MKHEVLSDGEGFQEETEDLEEEEDTGILNSEQEWLWNGSPSNLPNANIANADSVPSNCKRLTMLKKTHPAVPALCVIEFIIIICGLNPMHPLIPVFILC